LVGRVHFAHELRLAVLVLGLGAIFYGFYRRKQLKWLA